MSIKAISTSKAPAAVGPYNQGIESEGLIFVSGQLPINMETGELIVDDIKAATKASITNVKSILEEAGSSLDKVLKTTVFVTDVKDFDDINGVYAEFFSDHKPARSLVEVAALPKGAPIEMEVIATK